MDESITTLRNELLRDSGLLASEYRCGRIRSSADLVAAFNIAAAQATMHLRTPQATLVNHFYDNSDSLTLVISVRDSLEPLTLTLRR